MKTFTLVKSDDASLLSLLVYHSARLVEEKTIKTKETFHLLSYEMPVVHP